jgi:hypothetical protein
MKIKYREGLLVLLLLALTAQAGADLTFKPFVYTYRSAESPRWEQDAEVLAEVWWNAPSPAGLAGVTAIDGSYLYSTGVFEYAVASQPTYLNECSLSGLSSIVDTQYRAAAGSAIFSRTITASPGTPISFTSQPYRAYSPKLKVKAAAATGNTSVSFNTDYAKVLGKDGGGVTQTITGGGASPLVNLTIPVTTGAPPQNFGGPTAVANVNGSTSKSIGNTVKLDWVDINNAGAPFTNDDTPPILYDVYYNTGDTFASNPADESKVCASAINLTGSTVTLGGNGVPAGTPTLKDKTTYTFRMRAQDSTTDPENLGKHKTTNTDGGTFFRSVHVNDYTAPEGIAAPSLSPSDKTLTITFGGASQNNNDVAGYIVIRKDATTSDPAEPNLGGASGDVDGPSYSSIANGAEIIAGSGWIKVAQQTSPGTITDGDLDNNKKYKYAVYAYDIVNADQQGNNYTTVPGVRTGQPGAAPSVISNFIAISSPEVKQISLLWDKPTQDFCKGVKFVYTTNKADWNILDNSSPEAVNAVVVDTPVNSAVLTTINGAALEDTIYYFKGFAYNDSGMSKPEGAMAAAMPAKGGGLGGTFLLKASSTDRLVVNSIFVPAGSAIANASQLIDAINAKAGKPIVIVVGKWDKDNGMAVGLPADGSGGTDFLVVPGEGYQIYVNQDFALTLP